MRCLATGCTTEVSESPRVFCDEHWAMVPGATKARIRDAVWRAIEDICLAKRPAPLPGSEFRASHLAVCDACGREYIDHPASVHLPYLHVLCDGSFVKL